MRGLALAQHLGHGQLQQVQRFRTGAADQQRRQHGLGPAAMAQGRSGEPAGAGAFRRGQLAQGPLGLGQRGALAHRRQKPQRPGPRRMGGGRPLRAAAGPPADGVQLGRPRRRAERLAELEQAQVVVPVPDLGRGWPGGEQGPELEGGGTHGADAEAELGRDGGPDHRVGEAGGELGTEQEPEVAEAADHGQEAGGEQQGQDPVGGSVHVAAVVVRQPASSSTAYDVIAVSRPRASNS